MTTATSGVLARFPLLFPFRNSCELRGPRRHSYFGPRTCGGGGNQCHRSERVLNQGFQRNPCNRGTVADMCGIRMKETYCFFEGSLHSNRPMAAAALFIGRDVDARVGMQVKLAPGKTSDSLSLFLNASRSSSRLQDEINLILARACPCLSGVGDFVSWVPKGMVGRIIRLQVSWSAEPL
jgi:hypothetical protein